MPESDEYIYEIFKYFEEKSKEAPFPIYSLLKDFRSTDAFPTVFANDPHYNEAGHKIAAEAITRYILESDFLK
jgi:hypothetical protein